MAILTKTAVSAGVLGLRALLNKVKESKLDVDKYHQLVTAMTAAAEHFERHEKESYEEMFRNIHKIVYDCKYSEELALLDVSKMWHNSRKYGKVEGEYFSIDCVSQYLDKYGVNNICKWDAYVAFNANYHDKAELYCSWFPETEKCDDMIVKDAIAFYFNDDDKVVDNKVWQLHGE